MNNISRVYYDEIHPSLFNTQDALDLQFYADMIPLSKEMSDRYRYMEEVQMKARTKILADVIKRKEIPSMPDVKSATLGVSPIKDSTILFVEY